MSSSKSAPVLSLDMSGQDMREYFLSQTLDSLDTWEKNNWAIRENQPFDLSNPQALELTITPELAKRIALRQQVEAFAQEAKVSTAGVRENQNVICPWDHRYRINEYMLALMAESLSLLVPQLHQERLASLPQITPEDVRAKLGEAGVAVIEAVFEKPLAEAMEMVKAAPVRIVGGEVRANTPRFVGLASRIYAAHGLHVFLTENKDNKDSSTIFIWSFLTYMLGLSGGDYYTSSHGAPQKQSDKILGPDGSQYLPPEYAKIVEHMREILHKCETTGYTIKLAPADSPLLHHTLTYERIAKLYADYLRQGPASVGALAKIQEAIEKGMRLKLDFFGGSGYKTIYPVLQELGIGKAFENGFIRTEEDAFFHNIGFRVAKKKNSDELEVVHDSVDASLAQVVRSAGYETILAGVPVGQVVFNVDPDADRFVAGQIVPASELSALDGLGVTHIKLTPERLFALYSPNQFFLMLADNDHTCMVEDGSWEKYANFDIHTYVSALAWDEWAEHYQIPVIHTPVGFKEIAAVERLVENSVYGAEQKAQTEIADERGNRIVLGANPKVLHAGEESGGKIGGPCRPIYNILGQSIIAMREKSSGEACISAVSLMARLYLSAQRSGNAEDYFLHRHLRRLFDSAGIINRMEFRGDKVHYNEAIFDPEELAKAKKQGIQEKDRFNGYFRKLALAMQDAELTTLGRTLTISEVRDILSEAMPALAEVWQKLERIDVWSDGLQLWFRDSSVRDICLRPSGTDAKSKVYFDGSDKAFLADMFEQHFRNFAAMPSGLYAKYLR